MSRVLIDSGIGYLGNIPNDWNVHRIKNAFNYKKEIVKDEWENYQLLSLTTVGVKKKDIDNPNGKLPESFEGYQVVNKNDLIMCLFDLDCSAVFSGLSKYDGMISPAYKVIECKNSMNPNYAGYYFKYIGFDRTYMHYSKNIRYTLNYEEFSSLPIIFPSIEEQRKIADYLNKKCSKIDEIIKDNNKEIELLEEYKKSTIEEEIFNNTFVAKAKLSRIFKFSQGTQVDLDLQSDNKSEKYPYRFLRIIDYTQGNAEPRYVEEKYINYLIAKDELAIVRYGASAGFVCRGLDGVLANNMFKLNKKVKIDNDYIYYFFNSNKILEEMMPKSTAMPALDFSTMYNIKIPLYKLDEQRKISNILNEKYKKINKVIEYRKQIIEKLEEYKKSLIYECVTGKREV